VNDSSANAASKTAITAKEKRVSSATRISTNSVAAGALVSGALIGSSAAMAVAIQMQYLSYIQTAEVSLPEGMSGMYAGMNQKSMLPNFFSRENTSSGRRLDTYDMFDFLEEAGSFLSLLVLLFSFHVLIRLISLPLKGKLPKFLAWLMRKFEWALYLDFIGFAYLDLTLNSLLQIRKTDIPASDIRVVLNFSLSVIVLGIMVLFPLYTFCLLRKNRERLFDSEALPDGQVKEESAVRKRWEKLVDGIREDIVFAQYFQPVSCIQRFIYAFILVFLDPGKWLCLGLIFPSILITAFVVAFRPDDSTVQRFLHIFTEVQTLLLFVCIFLIKVLLEGEVELGWVIIVLSLGAMACGVVSFLLDIREKIANLCRKLCFRKQITTIRSEAYQINTEVFEDPNNSILRVSGLYPSHKEAEMRENNTQIAWQHVDKHQRKLSD
jgi:hypothetical protein